MRLLFYCIPKQAECAKQGEESCFKWRIKEWRGEAIKKRSLSTND
jgi:ArsR family metal-binding transcriptional regulator